MIHALFPRESNIDTAIPTTPRLSLKVRTEMVDERKKVEENSALEDSVNGKSLSPLRVSLLFLISLRCNYP
jgi:hypothetical protein